MFNFLTEYVTDSQNAGTVNKIARKRWQMLAQVLTGDSCADVVDHRVSVRRFHSFGLLSTEPIQGPHQCQELEDKKWFLYTCHDLPGFSMNISHLNSAVTAERLNGFNNTGNVCVWPSEEVMTYYCMQHVQDFKGKRVCELGGGMTCLAGVALGIYSEADHVELTDGNEVSVENLRSIIFGNSFGLTTVNPRQLRWGHETVDSQLQSAFDIIICADCLFFDDGREDLAHLIFDLLKAEGQALIFAPSRNKTFNKFLEEAEKLFQTNVEEDYDSFIWSRHQKMLTDSPNMYDASLHFPLLMKLTKPPSSSRDTTPESR